jgi:hypothetical protein
MPTPDDREAGWRDSERLRVLAQDVDEMEQAWRERFGETHVRTGAPLAIPSAALQSFDVASSALRAAATALRAAVIGGSVDEG